MVDPFRLILKRLIYYGSRRKDADEQKLNEEDEELVLKQIVFIFVKGLFTLV